MFIKNVFNIALRVCENHILKAVALHAYDYIGYGDCRHWRMYDARAIN